MNTEYRYTLTRFLPGGRFAPMVFCMLNPSTADEIVDDPTIRRCMGFAMREDCTGILVVNLYAMRATNPQALMDAHDPVGEHNDTVLRRLAASRIVCAWGAHGAAKHRAQHVLQMFRDTDTELLCLGTTASGAPRHPLYVKGDTPIIPYRG